MLDYEGLLEDTECHRCGNVGVEPDGGLDWVCPECGYKGSYDDEDE